MFFFSDCDGKLFTPTSKPRVKPEDKKKRVDLAKKTLVKIDGGEYYYCFLDEKWFYITSRRKKLKYLPPGPGETEEDARIIAPKMRSRRFPTKVMYLGVVAPPNTEKNFDGKIFLKRVSKNNVTKRVSYNQHFHDNFLINHEIKNGAWKDLCYVCDITIDELLFNIRESFDIDYDLADFLVVSYETYHLTSSSNIKSKRLVRLGCINGKDNEKVL